LVDRRLDAEARHGDRSFEDGRRHEPDLVVAFGSLRQRAFEYVPRAGYEFEAQLAGTLTASFHLDHDVAFRWCERRVWKPDAELDRLSPLIAAAVGLDLGLALADQSRSCQEPECLDPESSEILVAGAITPAPRVIERMKHRLAGSDELVQDQGQFAVEPNGRAMFGQHQRRRLLARGLEVPKQLG